MSLASNENLIHSTFRERLHLLVARQGEVIRFQDEPTLCSLLASTGLIYEIGRTDLDRLSPFFNVPLEAITGSYASLIQRENDFGVRIQMRTPASFRLLPRHSDLKFILSKESFDMEGNLKELIIYPKEIAETFHARGFELVIIRDWILNSALSLSENTHVPYLYANEWEIQKIIALMQSKLLNKKQLAFFGTHDIVDHLLDADRSKFDRFGPLFRVTGIALDSVFHNGKTGNYAQRVLAYLIGIILDDLAQPRWYGSEKHRILLLDSISLLPKLSSTFFAEENRLPESFHQLVNDLRNTNKDLVAIYREFQIFSKQLGFQSAKH